MISRKELESNILGKTLKDAVAYLETTRYGRRIDPDPRDRWCYLGYNVDLFTKGGVVIKLRPTPYEPRYLSEAEAKALIGLPKDTAISRVLETDTYFTINAPNVASPARGFVDLVVVNDVVVDAKI